MKPLSWQWRKAFWALFWLICWPLYPFYVILRPFRSRRSAYAHAQVTTVTYIYR